nr:EOG090X0H9E [Macrothrix elegans]
MDHRNQPGIGGTDSRTGFEGKTEPSSPIERDKERLDRRDISFSRCSSTSSLHTLSSAQNTDDEDSDCKSTKSYKERRREAHTQAEQKRRDAIKKGYSSLQDLVPTCQQQDPISGYKLSKATVLQRSIDYIQFLQQQKKKQEEELSALRKEVIGLQIMKSNYDQIVKANQNQSGQSENRVPDEVKFQVFQTIMENLFHTFDSMVSAASFLELSSCVFAWVEEHCKPQILKNLATSVLQQLINRTT